MMSGVKRRRWTDTEIAVVIEQYPDHYCHEIAARLKRPPSSIYQQAAKLGLKKSDAFRQRELAAQVTRLTKFGSAHRFTKGQVPMNKGLRRPGWHRGRMRETQFKKGQFPPNLDPDFYVIGALRVNTDGYIDMRVSFDKGASGWRNLHLILWEDAHGPIPRGHCLRFRDGDKLNVCLENMELITRADNMRRNTIHNLPKPLANTIQVLGQLKRRIREKQDRRSA